MVRLAPFWTVRYPDDKLVKEEEP
eukprot:COSAG02_NODE_53700_length_300_cov_0.761194_1_plen_23_part_10